MPNKVQRSNDCLLFCYKSNITVLPGLNSQWLGSARYGSGTPRLTISSGSYVCLLVLSLFGIIPHAQFQSIHLTDKGLWSQKGINKLKKVNRAS